jgi:hypothetical protein
MRLSLAQINSVRACDVTDPVPQSPALLVGQNRAGLWIVRDPTGMRGGVFSSQAEALRLATREHGRPRIALVVPTPMEFDLGDSALAASRG